ncbi:hypothetical protein [Thiomicrorhabdus aquaedulcis]|uniref:hypothetical protein n=1 Tax=Thiomicrorhabdus aquaedulcis TaxID=2211106 RepID=UPI000FD90060|nr:hypothetical protein [Thiomicrorhabdus aquaedulcis]
MPSLTSYFKEPLAIRLFKRLFVIFVLLILIGAASWYGFKELHGYLAAQEKPKIAQLNSLKSQVSFLRQQVALYEQYGEKYEELIKKGLVKKQDRVFWADSLIKMKDRFAIPNLKFEFSAEKALSTADFANIKIPPNVFFYSRVKLTLDLQHEEDLIRLFETISQTISPLYLVESCQTKLHDSDHEVWANFDLLKGNVATQCSLIVFHIHPKPPKPINGNNPNTQAAVASSTAAL